MTKPPIQPSDLSEPVMASDNPAWDLGRNVAPETITARRRTCPRCRGALVRIVYGFPSPELMAAVERGEFALGGCLVLGDDPARECSRCKLQFRTVSRPRRASAISGQSG